MRVRDRVLIIHPDLFSFTNEKITNCEFEISSSRAFRNAQKFAAFILKILMYPAERRICETLHNLQIGNSHRLHFSLNFDDFQSRRDDEYNYRSVTLCCKFFFHFLKIGALTVQ